MSTSTAEAPSTVLQSRLAAALAASDETTGPLGQTRRAAIAAALHYRDLVQCQERGILAPDDAELVAAALVARETQATLATMRIDARDGLTQARATLADVDRARRAAWVLATYPELAERLAEAERGMADLQADTLCMGQTYAQRRGDAVRQRLAGITARIAELGAQAPAD